ALNRHGSATALTLARETGVPRATVYRLLQTLFDDGYVGRGTADDRFHLRLKVRGLSEGFEDEQWITAIAGPALVELIQRTAWPCDVSTLEGLKMVIHETTHRIAPLSIDRNMVGQELPILGSSSGLAYISFAPKEEREPLLALLARSSDPHDALARDAAQVSRLVVSTRRRGYGLRQGGQIWPHTGSLALPVPRREPHTWLHQHGLDGTSDQRQGRRHPLPCRCARQGSSSSRNLPKQRTDESLVLSTQSNIPLACVNAASLDLPCRGFSPSREKV
ncbi:MAG: helix-turn-helix domain-containing protein, partial [Deltaproteobacteria bacterium]|nr:helix-turn-helix domain-containing protein [Deltaproteobacteria bacterium]